MPSATRLVSKGCAHLQSPWGSVLSWPAWGRDGTSSPAGRSAPRWPCFPDGAALTCFCTQGPATHWLSPHACTIPYSMGTARVCSWPQVGWGGGVIGTAIPQGWVIRQTPPATAGFQRCPSRNILKCHLKGILDLQQSRTDAYKPLCPQLWHRDPLVLH